MFTLSPFAHRENDDGTIDSICIECITVIASGEWEDLERAESEHKCDRQRIEYLREMPPYHPS